MRPSITTDGREPNRAVLRSISGAWLTLLLLCASLFLCTSTLGCRESETTAEPAQPEQVESEDVLVREGFENGSTGSLTEGSASDDEESDSSGESPQ